METTQKSASEFRGGTYTPSSPETENNQQLFDFPAQPSFSSDLSFIFLSGARFEEEKARWGRPHPALRDLLGIAARSSQSKHFAFHLFTVQGQKLEAEHPDVYRPGGKASSQLADSCFYALWSR